jgi:hypothetical protein
VCLTQSLTAKQVLAILMQFGFVVASQRGSHIKMTRIVLNPYFVTNTIMLVVVGVALAMIPYFVKL